MFALSFADLAKLNPINSHGANLQGSKTGHMIIALSFKLCNIQVFAKTLASVVLSHVITPVVDIVAHPAPTLPEESRPLKMCARPLIGASNGIRTRPASLEDWHAAATLWMHKKSLTGFPVRLWHGRNGLHAHLAVLETAALP